MPTLFIAEFVRWLDVLHSCVCVYVLVLGFAVIVVGVYGRLILVVVSGLSVLDWYIYWNGYAGTNPLDRID